METCHLGLTYEYVLFLVSMCTLDLLWLYRVYLESPFLPHFSLTPNLRSTLGKVDPSDLLIYFLQNVHGEKAVNKVTASKAVRPSIKAIIQDRVRSYLTRTEQLVDQTTFCPNAIFNSVAKNATFSSLRFVQLNVPQSLTVGIEIQARVRSHANRTEQFVD